MPNLYPTVAPGVVPAASTRRVTFGQSWQFDFTAGEFVLTPTGKVVQSYILDAWAEWCRKALMTARYRWLAYGRNYGQEFDDMIGHNFTRPAAESEIRRCARECLMADPRTKDVSGFAFTWEDSSTVFFTCTTTNVYDESIEVPGRTVIV
jgi:hypothetical protein